MINTTSILVFTIVILALAFDFVNGFHDTANSIATTISTRVMSPKSAIIMAAFLNFVGAITNQTVASTISDKIINNSLINLTVVISALIAAIIWNLITWYIGIPSSSSHALIGGLVGASVIYTMGFNVLKWGGIMEKVLLPLVTSPIIGFLLGFIFMKFIFGALAALSQKTVNKYFAKLQILSAALMSFSHGSNDAQKSMGIITMALIIGDMNGGKKTVPYWVMFFCALMMGLGTSVGGYRIIKTVGMSMMKLQPVHGFAAQTSGAAIIEIMTHFGAPVSTTQIISTSVMGVGSAKRLSAVRWVVAKNIVWAWILTLPITALLGGLVAAIFKLF